MDIKNVVAFGFLRNLVSNACQFLISIEILTNVR